MSREKINRSNKALAHWDDLLDDVQAIAAEYKENGWETLVLHPGDIATITEGDAGFRLIVPESELNALAEAVKGAEESFNEFELHRAPTDDLLLFIVVVKSSDYDHAILFPTYYEPDVDEEFVTAVREQGSVFTEITNLDQSRRYSFRHDDPSLFFR